MNALPVTFVAETAIAENGEIPILAVIVDSVAELGGAKALTFDGSTHYEVDRDYLLGRCTQASPEQYAPVLAAMRRRYLRRLPISDQPSDIDVVDLQALQQAFGR